MADRFLIAPYDKESGVQSDYLPWLIPDQAFSTLDNAYVWRGRVRKRFGSRWIGNTPQSTRLRINIGTTTNPAGDLPPTIVPGTVFQIGQAFSIGNTIFTVYQNGIMYTTGAATGTYNTANGTVSITGNNENPNMSVYFYPSTPIMGLLTYNDSPTIVEPTIAFDTQFSYQYNNATVGWEMITGAATPGANIWTGDDSQFFWATTWTATTGAEEILFVTNFNQNEPNFMRYYDGVQWFNYNPSVSATTKMFSCKFFVVFKNRLLAFNTWEGTVAPGINYPNLVRWTWIFSPTDATAWRQDIPGKGGQFFAPTSEAVVTAQFVRDRLIVYFEHSTWELVYNNNQIYPFGWYRINPELGAESTFSVISIGNLALGVDSSTGIHACNGTQVERIDSKIPNSVFDIRAIEQEVDRVYGIRDYFAELIYWTYASGNASSMQPYPTQVFVYNYKTQTWAFNDDSITCFGYFQPSSGITWDSTTVTWDDPVSWDSGGSNQTGFRQIIAGNQQGWTFFCEQDIVFNASVLQITNLTVSGYLVTITCQNHNLDAASYIYLEDITGTGNLSDLNNKIFPIINTTQHTFTFLTDKYVNGVLTLFSVAGIYSGGGTISRVSQITIDTKQYNFYVKEGRNALLSKIDFLINVAFGSQMQIQFFASTSGVPLLADSFAPPLGTGAILGTSNLDLYPYNNMESNSQRTWHPVYFQAEGQVVQFRMTWNDMQMRNFDIRTSDFQLHAMVITAQPTTGRLQ